LTTQQSVLASSSRTTAEPIKPAPPVTMMVPDSRPNVMLMNMTTLDRTERDRSARVVPASQHNGVHRFQAL